MKCITDEMWVSIIGAISAIIGAIISTISIILTNKNTKSLKLLENSKDVKTEISKKRLVVYSKIIEYINSWYDIKIMHNHDYSECKASRYLKSVIFECRLKNKKDIVKEYNTVAELSLEYFYLDAKSYQIIKSLEAYLSAVVNCETIQKINNFKLFSYIVYCDIWEYIFRLSKRVNNFINKIDTLKFKQSKSVAKSYIEKYYCKTNFYAIYDDLLLVTQFDCELKEKIMPDIERINQEIEDCKKKIQNSEDKVIIKLLNKKIKNLTKNKSKLEKIKFPNRYYKTRLTDTYKMWLACKNCKNSNCILSNKDGE